MMTDEEVVNDMINNCDLESIMKCIKTGKIPNVKSVCLCEMCDIHSCENNYLNQSGAVTPDCIKFRKQIDKFGCNKFERSNLYFGNYKKD